MDIKHTAHGPEWYVVKTPAQEQPGSRHHCVFPFLGDLWRFRHSSLTLETRVAVDEQEDDEEDNVSPPDDRVP